MVKVRVRVPIDRDKYQRERVRWFVDKSKRHVLVGPACAALVFVIQYLLKHAEPSPQPQ
jgi:hypothetical protein